MSFEQPNLENQDKDELKEKIGEEKIFEPKFKGEYYQGGQVGVENYVNYRQIFQEKGNENLTRVGDDARYRQIFQEKSMDYLKNEDKDWFESRFGGISDSGYLLDKNGQETNSLPSQNISAGIKKVETAALQEFISKYPEDAKRYGIEIKEEK
jgi:hypothetical protein